MKNSLRLTGLCFLILMSCENGNKIPQITTTEITQITRTTAVSGGNITEDNGLSVIQRGVCWSINADPIPSDNSTTDGAGGGVFISNLTDLKPNTTYFIRAYAINSAGTGYGMSLSFTTQPTKAPLLTNHIWVSDSLSANGVDASGPSGILEKFKGDTKFNQDGTGYFGNYTGTWRFNADETELVLESNLLALPIVADIKELTSSSLKLATVMPNANDLTNVYYVRLTYKAK